MIKNGQIKIGFPTNPKSEVSNKKKAETPLYMPL